MGLASKVVSSLAEFRQRKEGKVAEANPETVALLGHLHYLAERGVLQEVFVGFRVDGEIKHAATGAWQCDATLACKLNLWLKSCLDAIVDGTKAFSSSRFHR